VNFQKETTSVGLRAQLCINSTSTIEMRHLCRKPFKFILKKYQNFLMIH
jgi:hypothetical protein